VKEKDAEIKRLHAVYYHNPEDDPTIHLKERDDKINQLERENGDLKESLDKRNTEMNKLSSQFTQLQAEHEKCIQHQKSEENRFVTNKHVDLDHKGHDSPLLERIKLKLDPSKLKMNQNNTKNKTRIQQESEINPAFDP